MTAIQLLHDFVKSLNRHGIFATQGSARWP
jgi:hypothetical protein